MAIVFSNFTPLLTSGFAGQLLINVRDANSNDALVGVIPTIYLPTATQGPPTDETGSSLFPLLNAGTYTLTLKFPGYRTVSPSVQLYPNTLSYYVITMKKKL